MASVNYSARNNPADRQLDGQVQAARLKIFLAEYSTNLLVKASRFPNYRYPESSPQLFRAE